MKFFNDFQFSAFDQTIHTSIIDFIENGLWNRHFQLFHLHKHAWPKSSLIKHHWYEKALNDTTGTLLWQSYYQNRPNVDEIRPTKCTLWEQTNHFLQCSHNSPTARISLCARAWISLHNQWERRSVAIGLCYWRRCCLYVSQVHFAFTLHSWYSLW